MKWLTVLVLGLSLLVLSGYARATCYASSYDIVTVSFPSVTITLPTNPYPGLVFWTSPPVPVAKTAQGTCNGTTPNGLTNQAGGSASSSDDTLFPIGNTGLSYRILYTGNNAFTNAPNGVRTYGDQASASGNNINFDGAAQLQLVLTDPTTFAQANPPSVNGALAQWDVYGCVLIIFCQQASVIDFNASGITFVTPACNDPSVIVTLPTVFTSAFGGPGKTTGQTPFSVPLTCSGAVKLDVTLTTNTPAGPPGVIANTPGSGYAQSVGVQLLDGSCTTPFVFGTAISEGTTSNGVYNLPFCARYYQTGTSVTAGQVHAVATYTLTYP